MRARRPPRRIWREPNCGEVVNDQVWRERFAAKARPTGSSAPQASLTMRSPFEPVTSAILSRLTRKRRWMRMKPRPASARFGVAHGHPAHHRAPANMKLDVIVGRLDPVDRLGDRAELDRRRIGWPPQHGLSRQSDQKDADADRGQAAHDQKAKAVGDVADAKIDQIFKADREGRDDGHKRARIAGRRVACAPSGSFDHSKRANQGTTAIAAQVRLPDQGPVSRPVRKY